MVPELSQLEILLACILSLSVVLNGLLIRSKHPLARRKIKRMLERKDFE